MQSTFVPGVTKTMEGTSDVPQWRFIAGDGSPCGAGARAIGVSMIDAAAGYPFGVIITGEALIELGAAANAGDEVESDANGCAIPLDTGKANGVISATGTTGVLVPIAIK